MMQSDFFFCQDSLLESLAEHLNAEISSGTIASLSDALTCNFPMFLFFSFPLILVSGIKSTYLFVRVARNPLHYGVARGLTMTQLESHLQNLCLDTLHALCENMLITIDDASLSIASTECGE